MITLPYDGGFTVWVDGKKLTSDEIKKTFCGLLKLMPEVTHAVNEVIT